MAYFSIDGTDNVGLPSLSIDTIKFLNDSTIIEIRSRGLGWDERVDTVVNHPVCKIPHLTVDTLKGMYYRNDIEFVGFDTVLTRRELKRQKKWLKRQSKLKRKRAKLLKEYQEVDKKIVKSTGTLLMGDDNNNNTPTNVRIETSNAFYMEYFVISLFVIMFILCSILYFNNKTNVVGD